MRAGVEATSVDRPERRAGIAPAADLSVARRTTLPLVYGFGGGGPERVRVVWCFSAATSAH